MTNTVPRFQPLPLCACGKCVNTPIIAARQAQFNSYLRFVIIEKSPVFLCIILVSCAHCTNIACCAGASLQDFATCEAPYHPFEPTGFAAFCGSPFFRSASLGRPASGRRVFKTQGAPAKNPQTLLRQAGGQVFLCEILPPAAGTLLRLFPLTLGTFYAILFPPKGQSQFDKK